MSYKYKLIRDLVKTEYLNIAHFEDIGAMKLWAIQNRATNKDYVDLYYILQKISLNDLLRNFEDKFFDIVSKNLLLKSLVYFDDIICEELIVHEKIDFENVKKDLVKLVKQSNL